MNRRRVLLRRSVVGTLLVTAVVVLIFVAPRWFTEPEVYRPGGEVEGITRSLQREATGAETPFQLTDVAAAVGIEFRHFPGRRSTQLPEDMGSGVAWGDYDGDGDPDLYLVNISGSLRRTPAELQASVARNTLYENLGNGSFVDVTDRAGVGLRGVGMGASWGDVDGDGRLDLFATEYGRNHLFINKGDGRFEDATEKSGLGESGFWTGCSFGDYDNDHDLDLYVSAYVDYVFDPADTLKSSNQHEGILPYTLNPSSYPPLSNRLYRNDGGGNFTDVTETAGVANAAGKSLSVTWCDFDMDGLLDIYVANDVSDNVLYRNLGDGTFADNSHEAWVADYRGAMGLAVEDWDSDGDIDIFVTHWLAQENALYRNLLLETPASAARTTRFVDEADNKGLGQIALDYIGWGTLLSDLDSDGNLDLLISNGSTFPRRDKPWLLKPMRDQMFWNKGGEEGFFEAGLMASEYFGIENSSRGSGAADYDLDGDVDVLILNYGGAAVLLRNDGPQGLALRVRVEGPAGSPSCPGARIELFTGERRATMQVGASVSYLSQSEAVAHFGTGATDVVDSLRIFRPGREPMTLTSIPADRTRVLRVPWDMEGSEQK
jgi:enediyne biosynthesis protein E4